MWASPKAKIVEPEWIPKTYIGLAATCNSAPAETLTDFKTYQSKRDFRAMTYCHLRFELETGRISNFQVLDAVHDPGWTPPYSHWTFPTTTIIPETWKSSSYAQGESSPLSLVNTQARHKHSAIVDVAAKETVLVNSMIKFRAGDHTDKVGVEDVGCPYHVPWVWCEMLLTYSDGMLRIYGRGSRFPSHAWYLDGQRVQMVKQVGDSSFPFRRWSPVIPPRFGTGYRAGVGWEIATEMLQIYPVLAAGKPAWGPQALLSDERQLNGPVDTHPYTVGGREGWKGSKLLRS
jgi:hypothetical protein